MSNIKEVIMNNRIKVKKRINIFILFFFSLLFVFLISTFLFLNIYKPPISDNITDTSMIGVEVILNTEVNFDNYNDTTEINLETRIRGDVYNFLVVGIDVDETGAGRTDTIMLVSFNIKENMISILNIPRDTYVSTKQYSGKINGVYRNEYNIAMSEGLNKNDASEKGIKYLSSMIKFTFGIPVDRYILLDTEGFKSLVDEIGGIDMEIPIRMKYYDPYQDLYIDLQEGLQHLDGDKAEQLVRFRHGYITQDIGRIETQQKFIAALVKKLLKENIKNVDALYKVGTEYMTTNISISEATWFTAKLVNLKIENMRVHTLPGIWLNAPINHYEIYRNEAIEIINRYYNPNTQDIAESCFNIFDKNVGLYNHSDINIDGITLDNLIH